MMILSLVVFLWLNVFVLCKIIMEMEVEIVIDFVESNNEPAADDGDGLHKMYISSKFSI